ncbi:hypothetical protein GLE_4030 [Lysobacter enzymogenes]|uniref:Uncharacterized protein n=1 Tax=Lysobacter enzymogenes TaxID=69 RepID=A0A0S2DLC2_LYSEN|nr:hypothetical protein GLE_4030 [Lysobacter enzymogenes]
MIVLDALHECGCLRVDRALSPFRNAVERFLGREFLSIHCVIRREFFWLPMIEARLRKLMQQARWHGKLNPVAH